MINQELRKELDQEIMKHEPEIRDFLLGEYFRHNVDLIVKVNGLDEGESETLELEIILFLIKISDYKSVEQAIESEMPDLEEDKKTQVIRDVNEYIISKSGYVKNIIVQSSEDKKGESNKSEDLRSQIVDNMTNKKIDDLLISNSILNPIVDPIISPAQEVMKSAEIMSQNIDSKATLVEDEAQPDPYRLRVEPVDKSIKKTLIV
jgi:hypothetical protein